MEPICACIAETVAAIVALANPRTILLFNQKVALDGSTSSFKLCVVAAAPDMRTLEREIYLQVDCAIPFDVVLYRPEQWDALLSEEDSFACRVAHSGRVLYG